MYPGPIDQLSRPLHDLRISVTDRCNFRCTYCMPKEVFGRDFEFLPASALLSFEEITRLARIFIGLGVEKLRITGGEPLVRRDIERLIGMLAPLPGLKDLTLTTNGSLLARKAQALKDAGLNRVTVSLDLLDNDVFMAMNDVDFPVERVLEGIEVARAGGAVADQGEHGREARGERGFHLAYGETLQGDRHYPAAYRVHGRGRH